MWEWLVANGAWIKGGWGLVTLVIGLVLFMALRRHAVRIVRRLVPEQFYKQLGGDQKVLQRTVIGVGGLLIALVVAAVIVASFGVDITPVLKSAGSWLLEHGVRILIIIGIGYLIQVFLKALIPWIIKRSMLSGAKARQVIEDLDKRAQTLGHLFVQTIVVLMIVTIFFMILAEVGINIAPLLAGAGIVGIAIGFGAQSVMKDLINGIFIIAENQFNVGDVVKISDLAGSVESINLRRTVLRDLDGIVHSIPNGQIATSSNFTKGWSRVNLNITVSYGEDLDHCMEIINKVGAEMAKDEVFGPMLLSQPKAIRIDDFTEAGVEIKVLAETKPLKRWDVAGELRRKIKKAFDVAGIGIYSPRVSPHITQSDGKELS